MRRYLLFCLLLCSSLLYSQTLPSSRAAHWNMAGCTENYPEDLISLNILDYGAFPEGSTDNTPALNAAITALNGLPGVINFPEGHFLFTKPINLPSHTILRGASAQLTKLTFNLEGEHHLINAIGFFSPEIYPVSESLEKETQKIVLSETSSFTAGDYLYVFEEDQDLVHNDWAEYSTGQICRISQVNGQEVYIDQYIRRAFTPEKLARVRKIEPIQQVGIENLSIKRLDQTDSQTSNINFELAADCWVTCVKSEQCNFAHIEIERSTNIEVKGSYLKDAFNYGGGGKAYGVMLHMGTGDCLIENNIFDHLRHSMILQAGANGNVLAYNYSHNPYWTDVQLPSNAAGDLVLHGNYPYANLFEGNIVQNIVIDDSHGINGPYNTFFRNRAELYGLFMNNNPVSHRQNFIGNEITNPNFLFGLYYVIGDDHFEYGNNDLGQISPNPDVDLPEISCFKTDTPDFYQNQAWPSIGIPNVLEEQTIPAKHRYMHGWETECEVESVITSTSNLEEVKVKTYPNPVREVLEINSVENINQIWLYNSSGMLVHHAKDQLNQINIKTFENGLYQLVIELANHEIVVKKIIKI